MTLVDFFSIYSLIFLSKMKMPNERLMNLKTSSIPHPNSKKEDEWS
jgi:hypothetical protein